MSLSQTLKDILYWAVPRGSAELIAAIDANTAALPQSASPLIANGLGYNTGAGGSVTQATNRTTGVTINTPTGQITTSSASLAAEVTAIFTVTNSQVRINDIVQICEQGGTNGGGTKVIVKAVANGSFQIGVANDNAAGGTAETGAIIINFAIIRGALT